MCSSDLGMFGRGAILWGDANTDRLVTDPGQEVSLAGRVLVGRYRGGTGVAGQIQYLTRFFFGMVEGLDAAGVELLSKA